MNRNYIYLTVLMLILAIGTLMIKNTAEHPQIEPQQLMYELIQPTRYVSTDQVAKRIIQNDPTLQLIDVRPASEYDLFTLPRAINIPLDSILNKDNLSYFGIPGTKVILISNDDIAADQAWVITKRLGFNSTYVMKGGLNLWMETIIDPKQPAETDPHSDFETYSFRKGAQLYFTGAKTEVETSKVEVKVQRREKTSAAAGGC
ncbi:MAG: rhodanese-like domain-containing protein [Prolixibacteraceae bacterium]